MGEPRRRLGDVKEGRGDMGEDMPVIVYRLMQYTMLELKKHVSVR